MKKNKSLATTIWLVVALVLIVVLWFWLVPTVRSRSADLSSLQQQKTALDQRVSQLEAANAVLKAPVGAGGLAISYDDLERSLPQARLYEDLYAMIEKVMDDLGLKAVITVGKPVDASSTISATPIIISLQASYDASKALLDRLTTTLRPLSIDSFSMAPDQSGNINVSINATAYTRASTTNL